MMCRLALQMLVIVLCMQIVKCYSSCSLHGLVADCAGQNRHWVPALPSNISHLYLQMNYISELNDTALAGFEALLDLDLGTQHVRLVIRNNAFNRQKHLVRLVLGGNRGLRLEPNAFVGLSSLQQLYIDYSNLNGSILEGNYLQPLLSLETLDLYGNDIKRIHPAPFFSNLTNLTELRLEMNWIEMICEEDMIAFQGKHFRLLNLKSTKLSYGMLRESFDLERCGNPFRRMTFDILDIRNNGFNSDNARLFFRAIQGTEIEHLKFGFGNMGQGFAHENLPDPNSRTFEGLRYSAITHLEMSKHRINTLQKNVFRSLDEVIIIDISQNEIHMINENAFAGLQGHLRMLNMSRNLLGEIYSYTFTNLADLRVLDLSYNHIGALGPGSFSGLPNLRLLDLTGNSIRELGSTESLPSLDYLLLADNKLIPKTINDIIKLGSNSIHLNIEDNRLENLEDVFIFLTHFPHLKNFFFGGNIIKWCTLNRDYSTTRPKQLLVLDLHDSFLQVAWARGTCLTLFDHLENLVALSLSRNSLQALPKGIFRGLTSIDEMDLSSNSLTYLEPGTFPESLKTLDLSDNFLASPDPALFHSLTSLSLSSNRFYCDCELEGFLTWLNTTNVTFWIPGMSSLDMNLPVGELRCEFPPEVKNVPLLVYSQHVEPCEEDDERAVQQLRLSLFIGTSITVILVLFNAIIYARLRGQIFIVYKKVLGRVLEGPKPTPPAAADVPMYDAYLCFSNSDYRWVETALLKRLDNQFVEKNLLRCCFEARDFLPGEDHISNIRDAVFSSRKTICVVSKEFLKDGWCLEAFALAQGRMLEELTTVLIMLLVEKVPHYQLMKHRAVRAFVQKREYLVWPDDPQDLEWFYDRLVTQVLKDTKLKKMAERNVAEEEGAQGAAKPDDDNNVHIQRGNEDDIQLENENGIQLRNL